MLRAESGSANGPARVQHEADHGVPLRAIHAVRRQEGMAHGRSNRTARPGPCPAPADTFLRRKTSCASPPTPPNCGPGLELSFRVSGLSAPGAITRVKFDVPLALYPQHLVPGCQPVLLGPDPVAAGQEVWSAIDAVVRKHRIQDVPVQVLRIHLCGVERGFGRYRSSERGCFPERPGRRARNRRRTP